MFQNFFGFTDKIEDHQNLFLKDQCKVKRRKDLFKSVKCAGIHL